MHIYTGFSDFCLKVCFLIQPILRKKEFIFISCKEELMKFCLHQLLTFLNVEGEGVAKFERNPILISEII
jgi:hypothetical protein